MKIEALNTIVAARHLFDSAHSLCMVDDKHAASAGIVILQDAIELFFYASLIEKGADMQKSMEKLSFDGLIERLKKSGIRIIKSGSMRAMNKQRVIVKHYGQLAEPTTVRQYFEASKSAVDDLMQQVFGRALHEILLYDVIKNEETRECLSKAEQLIADEQYFQALVEVRKAVFLEVEEDYSIAGWKEVPLRESLSQVLLPHRKGPKARNAYKNKEWIAEHVTDPFGYIQLDHDRMRIDLLEWGVSTQDFWNLWRLTPAVFRDAKDAQWLLKEDIRHHFSASTEANARYCLDRAFSLILKKQEHSDLSRQLSYEGLNRFKVKLKSDQPLYQKASLSSKVMGTFRKGKTYAVRGFVPGLSGPEKFANIIHVKHEKGRSNVYLGYVVYDETTCELIDLGEAAAP